MTNRFQPVYNIAELCARRRLNNVVICPGSRSAPLVLAFTRHPEMKCRLISDERSAAFIALGISQNCKLPTVLICTSGTAAYNFAPAVAEAFFSQTPLLVLTADRPKEWVAQQDGQTIFQNNLYGHNVKQSFEIPQDYDHGDGQWMINRTLNEAISLSSAEPAGPVHINMPFREPLYPAAEVVTGYDDNVRVIEDHPAYPVLTEYQKTKIFEQWPSFKHVAIVAGQHDMSESRIQAMTNLLEQHKLPVVADILSNLHGIDSIVSHADLFMDVCSSEIKESLRPDLLITFGNSIISKSLKQFLRTHPPNRHWHIQPFGPVADTYQSITDVYRVNINTFLNYISSLPSRNNFDGQKQENYNKLWEIEERRALRVLNNFFSQQEFAEFEFVKEFMNALPPFCNLHVANSMSVRYANYIGLSATQKDVSVYANRGTSGIDGCTSTAVGHALVSHKPNFLITGDVAFFYDRNAFWHNYKLTNLRVVVLNNHGGIIFKLIDGPGALPEAEDFFVTEQKLSAKRLCEEFNFEYLKLDSKRKLRNTLADFIEPGEKTKILEIESSSELNKNIFNELKLKIKKSYEL